MSFVVLSPWNGLQSLTFNLQKLQVVKYRVYETFVPSYDKDYLYVDICVLLEDCKLRIAGILSMSRGLGHECRVPVCVWVSDSPNLQIQRHGTWENYTISFFLIILCGKNSVPCALKCQRWTIHCF